MANKINGNLSIENARIIFRNFSGKPSKFNREGDRNFCVVIDDPEQAAQLAEDGWNVRISTPRDEDAEPVHYIPVAVVFSNYPPSITLITGDKMNPIDEELVGELDTMEIKTCDIILRPYNWEVNGDSGVKAYLKTMYVVQEVDEFAHKYMNN